MLAGLKKQEYKEEIWTISWLSKTRGFWLRPDSHGQANAGKIYLSDGRKTNYEISGDQLRFDETTFTIVDLHIYPARLELMDNEGQLEIFELSQN